jgi:hypothetical protein
MFFKLKAGAHTSGDGTNTKYFQANDPVNNVVESDQDLAAWDPLKFEKIDQPPGQGGMARGLYGLERPPGPSSPEQAQLQAMLLAPITTQEMEQRARQFEELAKTLRERAQQAQQGQQQGQKEGQQWQKEAEQSGQQPTPQQDSSFYPGHTLPGTPVQGPGQTQLPPEQQKQRDLEEAKRQEQQARAQQEQQRAQQVAQERQGQQGQQAQASQKVSVKDQFARLNPQQQRDEDAKLERASVEQLRAVAEEEEVEVPKNANKNQIIVAIRQARRGQ